MALAPATSFVACFPLTEQFWDKDLNIPLAGGMVAFYSDPGFTVSKDVYYANGDGTFANAGSSLPLSSIGTFVYLGSNFIPFLWPYVGDPSNYSPPPAAAPAKQPYYITVTSAQNIQQFTVVNWPPNVTANLSSSTNPIITIMPRPFTATGVYFPTANMTYCIIECMGAGGGGGGTAVPGASTLVTGGGGGSGGYSRTIATALLIGPSIAITVGTGGAGGAAGTNPGLAGGTTSVGSLCSANGGTGGGTVSQQIGGAGASAGTGNLAAPGIAGFTGYGGANSSNVGSGQGASTQWGSGGLGLNGAGTGNAATGYGAGGSGGASAASGSNAAGGAGAPGYIFITEYISS